MQDFEKLGAFYLGRRVAAETGETTAETVLYDAKDLTTHAASIGMTGTAPKAQLRACKLMLRVEVELLSTRRLRRLWDKRRERTRFPSAWWACIAKMS